MALNEEETTFQMVEPIVDKHILSSYICVNVDKVINPFDQLLNRVLVLLGAKMQSS